MRLTSLGSFVFFLLGWGMAWSQTDPGDQAALSNLYTSLDDPGIWVWNTSTSPCSGGFAWIRCSDSRITILYLNSSSLNGTISSSIGSLSSLTELYMDTNTLTGLIPTALGALTNLTVLSLGSNQLYGSIPTELGGLTSLVFLNLEQNQLTGTIPTELRLLSLQQLYLRGNNFCPLVDYSTWASVSTDFVNSSCQACSTSFSTCRNGGICSGGTDQLFSCNCATGFTGDNCETQTCFNGVPLQQGCSCYSGNVGNDCSINSLGQCELSSVNPLATEIVAEFRKSLSSVTSNYFTFVIESPGRSQRYFQYITMNNANCTYPGEFFSRDFNSSSCSDSLIGNFSIPDLVGLCGFQTSTLGGYTYIAGSIQVSVIDPLMPFRGQPVKRTTKSILKIRLNLPNIVNTTTSSNLTLVGPVDLLVAVRQQAFDQNSGIATIEVFTSVQWPFQLLSTNVSTTADPRLSLDAAITDNTLCPLTQDSSCSQVTSLSISNISSAAACDFGGIYIFTWTFDCRSSFLDCPTSSTNLLQANVTLNSGNVCGSIEIDASIHAELSSFSDSGYSSDEIIFALGNRIYFKAQVVASVNLDSVTIMDLYVVQGGVTQTLVSGMVPIWPDYEMDGSSPDNEARFSFLATFGDSSTDLFNSSLSGGAVIGFTVKVNLEVNYRTTFGKRKRDAEVELISIKKEVVLDVSKAQKRTNAESSKPNLRKRSPDSDPDATISDATITSPDATLTDTTIQDTSSSSKLTSGRDMQTSLSSTSPPLTPSDHSFPLSFGFCLCLCLSFLSSSFSL